MTTHQRRPPRADPQVRERQGAHGLLQTGYPAGPGGNARRKATIEPVFGQMSTVHNAKQLLLRGLDHVRGEWLLAACHNLRKLHGVVGVHGLAAADRRGSRPWQIGTDTPRTLRPSRNPSAHRPSANRLPAHPGDDPEWQSDQWCRQSDRRYLRQRDS
ncbi:transposase [Rhodococcus opacus]|uniref:transposase n=1 Tax=Rhodococcus opacus TaxID=37919 RepID=UPI00352F8332